jgi:phage tail tape-measure protein
MTNLPISKIKDQPNLLRDNKSNAILFLPNSDSDRKRVNFFKSQQEDINNIKKNIQEIKNLLTEILDKLQEGINK